MKTATGTSLSELAAQAEQLKADYHAKAGPILAQIQQMAAAEQGDLNGTPVAVAATPTAFPAKKRGRPAGSKNVKKASTEATTSTKKRGRPPKEKTGDNDKVAPDQRNYSNDISLKQAIWQVLDQGPNEWEKSLPNLPEDAEGLTVSEIREMIDVTGIWKSSSSDIGPQVSGHLTKLKGEQKIARGNNKRYYIVEGAEL